jgi:formamidopyrimidine-DNA glycosylase
MPELPDVEGFRRVLRSHAVGLSIEHVDVQDEGVLHDVTARQLQDKLRGRRFDEPQRHGKWLIVPVGKGSMLLHFGMTGSLHWAESGQSRHRHDRVIFSFVNGELRYRDMRKLQGLRWAEDQQEVEEILAQLGPDAAEISGDRLAELLAGRRMQIKSALMDQSIIAGIGNLLADEILWRAGIHPRRLCIHLDQDDFTRLNKARQTVLRQSIKVGRVPRRKSWLTGRREDPSGACPRCGSPLAHDRIGGRATTWCPQCQRPDKR